MFGLSNKNIFRKKNTPAPSISSTSSNTSPTASPQNSHSSASQNIGDSVKAFLSNVRPFHTKKPLASSSPFEKPSHASISPKSFIPPKHVEQNQLCNDSDRSTSFIPSTPIVPNSSVCFPAMSSSKPDDSFCNGSNFDLASLPTLSLPPNATVADVYGNFIYGDVFIEIDQSSLAFSRYIALILFDKHILVATPSLEAQHKQAQTPKSIGHFIDGLVNLTKKESSLRIYPSWRILHCYSPLSFSFVPISKQSVRLCRNRDQCSDSALKDFESHIKNNRFAKLFIQNMLTETIVVMGRNSGSLEVMVEKLDSLRILQMRGLSNHSENQHASQPLSAGYNEKDLRNTVSVKLPKPPETRKVFGSHIKEFVHYGAVPTFLKILFAEVESRGATEQGIYRLSGTTSLISQLKSVVDKAPNTMDFNQECWDDINNVSGVIKLFFREMKEPLVPDEQFKILAEVVETTKVESLLFTRFQESMKYFDYANYSMLSFLFGHLKRIEKISSNQMNSSNLAIVFAPNLFSPCPDFSRMAHQQNIVRSFINGYDIIFHSSISTMRQEASLTTQFCQQVVSAKPISFYHVNWFVNHIVIKSSRKIRAEFVERKPANEATQLTQHEISGSIVSVPVLKIDTAPSKLETENQSSLSMDVENKENRLTHGSPRRRGSLLGSPKTTTSTIPEKFFTITSPRSPLSQESVARIASLKFDDNLLQNLVSMFSESDGKRGSGCEPVDISGQRKSIVYILEEPIDIISTENFKTSVEPSMKGNQVKHRRNRSSVHISTPAVHLLKSLEKNDEVEGLVRSPR